MENELGYLGAVQSLGMAPSEQGLRQSLMTAVDKNPDTEAQLQGLAKQYQVPVDAVRLDREFVDRSAKLDAVPYAEIVRGLPATGQLLSDPQKAAVAHDDIDNLTAIEKLLRYGKQGMGALASGAFAMGEGAAGVGQAGAELLHDSNFVGRAAWALARQATGSDYDPGNPLANYLRGVRQQQTAWKDYLTPQGEGNVEKGVYSGLQSLGQNLLTLPFALYGGGAQTALNLMSGITAGQSYGRARDAGLDSGKSAVYGAGDAAIEYATEATPMNLLFKDLKAGSGLFKTFTHQLASEIPSEQVATALQDLNEWAVLHPEKTLDDYIQERPDAAIQTLIATTVGAGGQVGLLHATNALIARDKKETDQALAKGDVLRELGKLAADSKLAGRDAEAFKHFVETIGAEAVYVDAGALIQSGLAEPLSAQIPSVAEQLRTAVDTGTELRIPVAELALLASQGDAVTHTAAQPEHSAFNGLADHARMANPAMPEEFIKTPGDGLRLEIEQALKQHTNDAAWQGDVEQIHQTVFQQLNSQGIHPVAVNERYSRLISGYFATQAHRLELTPAALFTSTTLADQRYQTLAAANYPGGDALVKDTATLKNFSHLVATRALPHIQFEQAGHGEAVDPSRQALTQDTLSDARDAQQLAGLAQADLATFLYETGRFFLDMQFGMAASLLTRHAAETLTPRQQTVLQDSQTVLDWLGVADLSAWQTGSAAALSGYYEQFASGFEYYLLNDMAPSLPMQAVFKDFGHWLATIYQHLDGSDAAFNPQVKAMLSGMLPEAAETVPADATHYNDQPVTSPNLFAWLTDNARLAEEKFSPAAARQYLQAQDKHLQAEVAHGLQLYQAESGEQAQVQAIKQSIILQLEQTGRFTPVVHEDYANLIAQFYLTQARRFGISPLALWERYPLRISSEDAPTYKRKTHNTKPLKQTDTDQTTTTPPTHPQKVKGVRGSFTPDTNTITLFKEADLSTFLHESGHFFLEMQFDLSSQLLDNAHDNTADGLFNQPPPTAAVAETASPTRLLGAHRVNTVEDAAQAFAALPDQPVPEQLEALITDSQGKPLAVLGLLKGKQRMNPAFIEQISATALRVKGAAHIWFARQQAEANHAMSYADRLTNAALTDAFMGSKITPKGLFVIARKGDNQIWRHAQAHSWLYHQAREHYPPYADRTGIISATEQTLTVPLLQQTALQQWLSGSVNAGNAGAVLNAYAALGQLFQPPVDDDEQSATARAGKILLFPGSKKLLANAAQQTDTDHSPAPLPATLADKVRNAASAKVVQLPKSLTHNDAPEGRYIVKTKMIVKGTEQIGRDTITTPMEAAMAFGHFVQGNEPRFGALVTDAQGKPLALVGNTERIAIYQETVFVGIVASEAFRIKGADKIWFVKYRPDRQLGLYYDDRYLNYLFTETFRGTSIEPQGFIILNRFAGAHYIWTHKPPASVFKEKRPKYEDPPEMSEEDTRGYIDPGTTPTAVPVISSIMNLHGYIGKIDSIADIMKVANGKSGILLLDLWSTVSAFVPLDSNKLLRMRENGYHETLHRALSMTNPDLSIIVNQGNLSRQKVRNVQGFLNLAGVDVLDIVEVEGDDIVSRKLQGKRVDKPITFNQHPLASTPAYATDATQEPEQTPGQKQLLADTRALLHWFGLQSLDEWYNLSFEHKRDYHEQFARGFERYLFEGVAPSSGMREMFERFKAWLLQIYKSAHSLRVNLTDEVREVFDRMLASSAEIAEAQQARGRDTGWESAEQAGMSAAEFADYQYTRHNASQQAVSTLQHKALQDMQWRDNAHNPTLREMQNRHEALRQQVRAQVEQQVKAQPLYAAWYFLTNKDGEKLDDAALSAMKLPSVIGQRLHKLGMVATSGGWAADVVAELFGFSSGDQLLRALVIAEPLEEVISRLTEVQLLTVHSELGSPVAINKVTERLLHNDWYAAQLAIEANTLAEAAGEMRLLGNAASQYAEQVLMSMKLADINSEHFDHAEAKAAQAASQALYVRDLPKAAVHKREQLLCLHAYKAALKLEDEVQQALHNLRGLQPLDNHNEYARQIKALLQRFHLLAFAPGYEQSGLAVAVTSLDHWLVSLKQQGLELSVPDWLRNPQINVPSCQLTLPQFRTLLQTIQQLHYLQRQRPTTDSYQQTTDIPRQEVLA